MQPPPTLSTLGQRYAPHIADLCARLAHEAARHRRLSPLLVLVWFRLRRMLARLDRLAARWEHAHLRPTRLLPTRRRARAPRTPPRIHPGDAWLPRRTPQGRAWLIRLHQPLAQFAPRVQSLLEDPEISALCAAAPQAARLLRPLAHMFGLAPPKHLRLPPRAKPPPKPPSPPRAPPPPFRDHSPGTWPFVPRRLRLKVPGLRAPARHRTSPA